jgi:Transglutaminase-like superfamily
MPLASDLQKLRRCSWSERRLLLEAAAWLALGRAAILLLSFQHMAGWLGLAPGDAAAEFEADMAEVAARIGWAVRTVAVRTAGIATCLVQALAGAAMLRRRGIPFALSLGVARNGKNIAAHAWLGCGHVILTGAAGHERFTLISTFIAPRAHAG